MGTRLAPRALAGMRSRVRQNGQRARNVRPSGLGVSTTVTGSGGGVCPFFGRWRHGFGGRRLRQRLRFRERGQCLNDLRRRLVAIRRFVRHHPFEDGGQPHGTLGRSSRIGLCTADLGRCPADSKQSYSVQPRL